MTMRCPICKKLSDDADAKHKPFCGDRCKLIDLGRWLDGAYQIEAMDKDDEVDESTLDAVTPPETKRRRV
jgi:uncharacterized protein